MEEVDVEQNGGIRNSNPLTDIRNFADKKTRPISLAELTLMFDRYLYKREGNPNYSADEHAIQESFRRDLFSFEEKSLSQCKETWASKHNKTWQDVQKDFELGVGLSKVYSFEKIMDEVAEIYKNQ